MKTLKVLKDVRVGDVGYKEGAVIHVEDERGVGLVKGYPESFEEEGKLKDSEKLEVKSKK